MEFLIPTLLLVTVAVWIGLEVISRGINDPDIPARFVERLNDLPSRIPHSASPGLETYIIFDLVEDSVLGSLFSKKRPIFDLLRLLTQTKIATVSICLRPSLLFPGAGGAAAALDPD